MNKKILMCSVTLAAGAFTASHAQQVSVTQLPITLDVVVRDFQPSHPDFENFSEESVSHLDAIYAYKGGANGYDITWYNNAAYHNTCGNMNSAKLGAGVLLGNDGLPTVANPLLPTYVQQTSAVGGQLTYGECGSTTVGGAAIPGIKTARGFKDNVAQFTGIQKNTCSGGSWQNPVYYTPGMVQPYLAFDSIMPSFAGKPNLEVKEFFLNHTVIQKNADACDNQFFDQWFRDVSGVNKRTNMPLDLPVAADNPNFKELNYNYNNGGYFPLDVLDANGLYAGQLPGSDQFGAQSFSIFCPPYNYQYASTQADYLGNNTAALCNEWNAAGGAKSLTAESALGIANNVVGGVGLLHLRNYNFTMMGYAPFQYYESNNQSDLVKEVFEFAGDDDMWIFIDGVLVVDLGGTHLATPGIVDVRNLAMNNHGCAAGQPLADVLTAQGACGGGSLYPGGWTDGSWHHMHFFYADRQTDGSNLYIRANLAAVGNSAYGGPVIEEAELLKNEETGRLETYIYTSSQLSDESVATIAASNGTFFPILVKRKNAVGTYDTLAYKVEGFEWVQKASQGYEYKISGLLCTDLSCAEQKNPARGDSLTFNYMPPTEDNLFPAGNRFYIPTAQFTIMNKMYKAVDHYGWGPVTSVSMGSSTAIIPADNTIERPPFDMNQLEDGELSDDATGEILIATLPEDYAAADNQSSWIADNIKALTTPGAAGQQVINSKTNGSASGAESARCGVSSNGVENCVSFSFVTDEAFRVNIRIFDHLGHFVAQYNQEVSPAEFNQLTQSNTEVEGQCSHKTGTGSIAASVKMYPVSQDGRKLGTGAYIYQISLIEFPQPHCVNIGGEQQYMPGEYRRTEYKQVRGFRRVD